MSSKPRRPIYFPKMKLRGSKIRRQERIAQAYVWSGKMTADIQKMNEALPGIMDEMNAFMHEVVEAMNSFVEEFFKTQGTKDDYVLATPHSN